MSRKVRAPAVASLLKSPRVRRAVAIIIGAALGASCPLWPTKAQPICVAVSAAIRGELSSLAGP